MVDFIDGKIVLHTKYHEKAKYDMSNECIAVCADGRGGLTSYRVANHAGDMLPSFLSLDLSVEGEQLSPYLPKTVEMIGRMQKIILKTRKGDLSITTFLGERDNGVFFLLQGEGISLDLGLNCRGAKSASARNVSFVEGENFRLSSSAKGDWVEENDAFYLSATGEIQLYFSFGECTEAHSASFSAFDRRFARCLEEIREVSIPTSAKTEEERALYYAAYFTALQNHKTIGDFRAFVAGINYLDPVRTYYRDSYFTVLPMLRTHPELVRDEILTLARGVTADGACPSAVKSDFTAFWGDHYDSPSFFVIEVYDYVEATGDWGILQGELNGRTLLSILKAVLSRLITKTNETGLIYKEGAYNKRDWADEVNRAGYVTFVNVLFYRALVAASRLLAETDGTQSALYARRAELVKQAINTILFDEEKGYYVNYKTESYTEDNLSIDTIFALIFGVADERRAQSVLERMERLLETRYNDLQGGGDYGVMCVYPPYKLPRAACHKSARMYDYHNGANWCYLTAMYAYAKSLFGGDWRTPLLTTFRYMISHGNYTLIEYFSPCCDDGSALQGWSAAMAIPFDQAAKNNQ